MLHRSHDESAGHFWHPEEFENVVNPDFENLKHLQNPGYLSLTAPSITPTHFLRRFPVRTRFPEYIPSSKWIKKSLARNTNEFGYFCKSFF